MCNVMCMFLCLLHNAKGTMKFAELNLEKNLLLQIKMYDDAVYHALNIFYYTYETCQVLYMIFF